MRGRTKGPIGRVSTAEGSEHPVVASSLVASVSVSHRRRFSPRSSLLGILVRHVSSCTSLRALWSSREINEVATYWQASPGLSVRIKTTFKAIPSSHRRGSGTAGQRADTPTVGRVRACCHLSLHLAREREREREGDGREGERERESASRGRDRKRKSRTCYGSLTFRTLHVSDPISRFFLRQRFVHVPELEACGRLLCCVQRLCRSGSAADEPAEHRINARGRRGARAESELVEGQGASLGPEDGMLAMPVSPSPASTSSQEDACKPPPRNCYRLVMLGSARVGKTAIVARFLSNKFEESYTPTIEDFHRKLYRIRGEVHQLDLLDTSGNHPFPAMRRLSFLTGDLFVVVFSMDCRESFEEAIRLREAILETKVSATQSATKSRRSHFSLKVPMVIVGNKCDKDVKTVTVEEAEQYCVSQDECCIFVEVSAKRNYHVDELFYQLFVVAGLPLEMAPNHHRKVPLTFGSPTMLPPSQPRHKATLSIKRRLSDACGVVAPNVRRPSIRTDLMIMRTKTCSLAAGGENNAPGSRITLRTSESRKACSIQ